MRATAKTRHQQTVHHVCAPCMLNLMHLTSKPIPQISFQVVKKRQALYQGVNFVQQHFLRLHLNLTKFFEVRTYLQYQGFIDLGKYCHFYLV
jgi:hypothetical protein